MSRLEMYSINQSECTQEEFPFTNELTEETIYIRDHFKYGYLSFAGNVKNS